MNKREQSRCKFPFLEESIFSTSIVLSYSKFNLIIISRSNFILFFIRNNQRCIYIGSIYCTYPVAYFFHLKLLLKCVGLNSRFKEENFLIFFFFSLFLFSYYFKLLHLLRSSTNRRSNNLLEIFINTLYPTRNETKRDAGVDVLKARFREDRSIELCLGITEVTGPNICVA